jgi:hypothetical protein
VPGNHEHLHLSSGAQYTLEETRLGTAICKSHFFFLAAIGAGTFLRALVQVLTLAWGVTAERKFSTGLEGGQRWTKKKTRDDGP